MDAPFPIGMLPEIERFLKADKSPPRSPEGSEPAAGQDSYPAVFATRYFFPLQRRRELEAMMRIARSINPKTVCELGADKGAGLYHWLKCLPSVQRLIACEIRGCPYSGAFEDAFPAVDFMWVEQSSHAPRSIERVRHWLASFNDKPLIDVLFIDGDKDGMLKDFDAYLPLMNPDGIVFLHDVREHGPAKAWAALKQRGYRYEHIIDISESEEAMERERLEIPAASEHEKWLRHWKGASCTVGVIYLGGRP